MKESALLFVAALVLGFGLVACSSVSSPLRTALVDITGESRTIEVYPPGVSPWPIAVHKQALSIGGLLNIPDVGQEFEFPGSRDVTTAVGIAVAQSYRLVGEAEVPPEWDVVTRVRAALEETQALALDASLLTAEIAALKSRMRDEGGDFDQAELKARILERVAVERDLKVARAKLRDLANTPGVVIARWDAKGESGTRVQGSPAVALGLESTDDRSGFVILGGLRVVSLVFGEDFWWLINNLRPHEKKHVEQIGVTTQLIQARDVAYTSSLLVNRAVEIQAEIRRLGMGEIEAARLSSYWSFVGQYSNAGNLPRIKWVREPFCMVCSLDLPGLADPGHRALQKAFRVEEKNVDLASYQGWRTVSANVTYLRDVPLFFKWSEHAQEYAARREMKPSRSCPFCGEVEEPAVIRGWEEPPEEARR